MTQQKYKPGLVSRARAFVFTDRNGQTLAATLGFFSVARWWLTRRLRPWRQP